MRDGELGTRELGERKRKEATERDSSSMNVRARDKRIPACRQ